MTPTQLDHIFPYVCFAYGATMTIALNVPALARIADEHLAPELATQWRAHRGFALLSMCVGAAWILQNLWLK
jgi:hypothetical protein